MNRTHPLKLVVGALLTILIAGAAPSPVAARSGLVGTIEAIDQAGIVSGWAQDLDTPSQSISVHFYGDGLAGSGGTFVGAVTASIPRGNPGSGPHGFRFSIPSWLRDGNTHTLYVYGIDSSGIGSENAVLSTTPHSFTLSSTVVRLDNSVIRFGVEPRCGGTLVEMSLNGNNFINNFDCTGRQVQVALYDGNSTYDSCGACQGVWGWDPVQGGDFHNFGSPLTAQTVTADLVYIATQPYEWFPDNKGGGPGRPVLSDVTIEQTASFVPGHPHAIRLHYRIHHFGQDTHAQAIQEFPAVYVNRGYDNFVSYSGTAPWTGGAVTSTVLTAPGQAVPQRYVPERWASLVNSQGVGLTVYVPRQYPYLAGLQFAGSAGVYGYGANYFRPHVPFSFGPGSVLEADIYVIAGDYRVARQTIEALHAAGIGPDVLPPFGALDTPGANQTLSGIVPVSGWVFDDSQIARVEVMMDGSVAGTAAYGSSRPDVAVAYPNAPAQIGFSYSLDTRTYVNGTHQLRVRAIDTAGNIAILADSPIVVANSGSGGGGGGGGGGTADTTAPAVSISSITTSGSRQSPTITVQASDAVGVARVRLYLDNKLVGTDTTSPYRFSLDGGGISRGTHQFVARAYDAAGNVGVSAAVSWRKR